MDHSNLLTNSPQQAHTPLVRKVYGLQFLRVKGGQLAHSMGIAMGTCQEVQQTMPVKAEQDRQRVLLPDCSNP
jgi:hypothetical protein